MLHRKQIDRLAVGVLREGLTIVPLKIFFNPRGRVKVDIALARGRKTAPTSATPSRRVTGTARSHVCCATMAEAMRLPDVALPATDGTTVNPGLLRGRVVIFVYPYTGKPGVPDPPGWDQIFGAHGSTPQALAFSRLYPEFASIT